MNDPVHPQTTPPRAGGGPSEDDAGNAEQVAGAVEAEGRQLAESAAAEARSVGQTAQEQAGRVAHELSDKTRGLVSSATENVEQQAEEQAHRLAAALRSAGEQARALADGRPDESGGMDGYVHDIAGTLGDIAGRIDRLGARGSVEELRQFARRRPGVFLAGAAAAGFLTSRFVRNVGEDPGDGGEQDRQHSLPPATTPSPAPVGAGRGDHAGDPGPEVG